MKVITRGSRAIEMDRTPVLVRGEALHPVIWRGRQWAVTEYGIEALDGTYVIEKSRLDQDLEHGHSAPTHMGEKDWVDHEEFMTAWLIGLLLHGCAERFCTPKAMRSLVAGQRFYENG